MEKKILVGIVCCHVDEFVYAGEMNFQDLLHKLKQRFQGGKVEEQYFQYIGFHIKQNEYEITVDHSKLIEKLDQPHIDSERPMQKHEQLTAGEQTLCLKLNWAIQGSCPDKAFKSVDLSTKLKTAAVTGQLLAV